jgi:DNA polymerase phi
LHGDTADEAAGGAGSDSDEEGMDDDQMFRMDDKIAAVLRASQVCHSL